MEKVGEEKDHGAPSTPTPGKQLKLWQTAPEALETKPLTPPRTPGRRSVLYLQLPSLRRSVRSARTLSQNEGSYRTWKIIVIVKMSDNHNANPQLHNPQISE